MLARLAVRAGFIAALLVCASAAAQSFDPSALKLLRDMGRAPTTLARYSYLIRKEPSLSPGNQLLALQFMAFSQDELGLYDQAVFDFPLKNSLPNDFKLPASGEWRSADAVDTIAALATQRHIVMVNEAHHDGHTRQLTLELLPRLRALGFTYFAAEALGENDPDLAKRGYPLRKSGTEYLRDPLYGDILREAIRLGFTLVPYDNALAGQARETAQAEALYQKVFAKDPHARLFVHAGYAHIDKAPGRLGKWRPMAMQLQKLTGLVPLCIDQTDFLETDLDASDAYHRLVHAFPSDKPEVLLNRQSGQPWSARPAAYDVDVILPPSLSIEAFGKYKYGFRSNAYESGLPHVLERNEMQRAAWLSLGGKRRPYAIDSSLCRGTIPCVVGAYYPGEPNDAIAADRYAFMGPIETSKLYLRPGSYQLRASDSDGHALSESDIRIAPP
ncbi:hypothetical protein [Rhodanobacter geophilus]|uniref:Haem-binding uptake Tiki superfamily ChaN domain-containing protein n=1 Tax=Rhodanobacter geophilus TaxID=3162488 RepID=A0ABV3QP05_9GAMM